MKIFTWLGYRLRALLGSVLFVALLGAVFIAYRVLTFEQLDNQPRLQGKHAYLETISANVGNISSAPNIILILYDDMGYGDIGAGASKDSPIRTPNIDRLAANGVVLSDFHSPAAVCTPSRAGFLTGRLPPRAGMPDVVFPTGSVEQMLAGKVMNPTGNLRLPEEEITLADVLKAAGYRTGMVGKWHLGDRSPSLPNDMGFDSYFGALYSNDMQPFALYRNREIAVSAPVDQRYLTETYTDEVTRFIDANSGEKFSSILPTTFPTTRCMCDGSAAACLRRDSTAM